MVQPFGSEPKAARRLPIAAALVFATAVVNVGVAWLMWGDRGTENRQRVKQYLSGSAPKR